MLPKNCLNCGFLFMPHNPKIDIKYCNNCISKYEKKEEKKSVETKMLITLTSRQAIEIEEICINDGITISEYFSKLHESTKPLNENEYEEKKTTKKKEKK